MTLAASHTPKAGFEYRFSPQKIEDLMARSLYFLEKDSVPAPFRLFVYPSVKCNDHCGFCSDGLHKESETWFSGLRVKEDFFNDRKYIDRLAEDIRALKIRDIHFFGGGEPFYYKKNMFYFLEKIRDCDVFIRIITNTNGLSLADAEQIVAEGLVSQLNISFNTDSSETARKIYRSSRRHEHSLEILRALAKAKKARGAQFPLLDIMTVILNVNHDQYSKIIDLVEGCGINSFFFQPLRLYSSKQEHLALSADQHATFVKEAPQLLARLDHLNIRTNLSEFISQDGLSFLDPKGPGPFPTCVDMRSRSGVRIGCYIPLTTLSLCHDGHIPVCQFRYDQQYAQNYFRVENLAAFFQSREYRDKIKNFTDHDLPEMCRGCNFCVPSEWERIKRQYALLSDAHG